MLKRLDGVLPHGIHRHRSMLIAEGGPLSEVTMSLLSLREVPYPPGWPAAARQAQSIALALQARTELADWIAQRERLSNLGATQSIRQHRLG